jgi:hypothetical protein
MSIRNAVMLTVLAVVSVSAMAESESKPQTTLTAPGMATTDGILTYCRRIDTASAAKYTLAINNLTQGHSRDELEDIRASKQYTETLAALNVQLLKVSNATGVSACRSYIAGN